MNCWNPKNLWFGSLKMFLGSIFLISSVRKKKCILLYGCIILLKRIKIRGLCIIKMCKYSSALKSFDSVFACICSGHFCIKCISQIDLEEIWIVSFRFIFFRLHPCKINCVSQQSLSGFWNTSLNYIVRLTLSINVIQDIAEAEQVLSYHSWCSML